MGGGKKEKRGYFGEFEIEKFGFWNFWGKLKWSENLEFLGEFEIEVFGVSFVF